MSSNQQLLLGTSPPVVGGQVLYNTITSTNWTCPAGVTSVSVVCVGAGGHGFFDGGTHFYGGGGGGLAYLNNFTVVPGNSYAINISQPGNSSFNGTSCVATSGANIINAGGATAGTAMFPGGNGGHPDFDFDYTAGGGGGAGGYAGSGGTGGNATGGGATAGTGGGGGGGTSTTTGGGVGIYGQGADGAVNNPGSGGSGTQYGGGGWSGSGGGLGAVRIIWPGNLRQFPSTRTADE